jgi:ribosomal protein L6P/L9E
MTVKGPLGELKKNFRDDVSVTITANSTTGAKEIASSYYP